MTSKERAKLKGEANSLEALFQVGKGGISDALIQSVEEAFKTRELLKLKVLLETAPEPPKEIAVKIAEQTSSEVVQVIGGSMIFYRENKELHEPKKSAKKPDKKKAKKILKSSNGKAKRLDSTEKSYGAKKAAYAKSNTTKRFSGNSSAAKSKPGVNKTALQRKQIHKMKVSDRKN